jgi:hypothetical protein
MNKKNIMKELKLLTWPIIDLAILILLAAQLIELNNFTAEMNRYKELARTAAVTTTAPEEQEPEPEPKQEAITEQMVQTFAAPKAEAEPEPAPQPQLYTEKDVELIGRTIWGEAGGVQSKAERAAVAWCILNRVDAFEQSIEEVVTAPYQFQGYRPEGDCPEEHFELAEDVLERWQMEKYGIADVGRVLPADCLYFLGDGQRNHFTNEWQSTDYWGWELPDPYK